MKEFYGIYLSGYPGLEVNNVRCKISLENEFKVYYDEVYIEDKLIFKIPYEKIDSITIDAQKEWVGGKMALGWVLAGPVGLFLMGKKKKNFLAF